MIRLSLTRANASDVHSFLYIVKFKEHAFLCLSCTVAGCMSAPLRCLQDTVS